MSLIKHHNHWPGGIPSCIRRSEEPVDDFELATRGWRHFVHEQWIIGGDEDQKRRALIERWATAHQGFRDSYHSRAPENEPRFENRPNTPGAQGDFGWIGDVCICISEWTLRTEALLAKCLLCIFGWDSSHEYLTESLSALMPTDDCLPNSELPDSFLFRASVARPDFLVMHMTKDGTVVFEDHCPALIIDDRTLETGLALWVEFENNGVAKAVYRAQMFMDEFRDSFRAIQRNMDPIKDVLLYMEDDEQYETSEGILSNKPVDLTRPFADLYTEYIGEEHNHDWACEELDKYAPGYRDAEEKGNGLALGYDLRRMLINDGLPLEIHER